MLERAIDLIRRLAADCGTVDRDGDRVCHFCGAWLFADHPHHSDCVYADALKFLEEVDRDGQAGQV